MNIEEMLDSQLAKEQAVPRKRSGKFSPSSFGQCYRRQIWNRRDETVTNPPSSKALRIFKIGKLTHEYFQSLIPNNKEVCEKHHENDNFNMYTDWVNDDFIEDFKTVNGYKFKKICNPNTDINSECIDYILQLMGYCKWFGKPKGRLTFINKDDWKIKPFEFLLTDWIDKVDEEIDLLMAFWKSGKLPPAMPKLYRGRECTYCAFLGKDGCGQK